MGGTAEQTRQNFAEFHPLGGDVGAKIESTPLAELPSWYKEGVISLTSRSESVDSTRRGRCPRKVGG